jgi:hypothetical protein
MGALERDDVELQAAISQPAFRFTSNLAGVLTVKIEVGEIETNVPHPGNRDRPLRDEQKRVLELSIGDSFVVSDVGDTNRLQCWARTKGIKLACRIVAWDGYLPIQSRVWRVG